MADLRSRTRYYRPEISLGLAVGEAKLCGVHVPLPGERRWGRAGRGSVLDVGKDSEAAGGRPSLRGLPVQGVRRRLARAAGSLPLRPASAGLWERPRRMLRP